MSEPFHIADIVYDRCTMRHLLLVEPTEYEDDDGYTKEAWIVLMLETGEYTWCWEFVLEDTVDFLRVA